MYAEYYVKKLYWRHRINDSVAINAGGQFRANTSHPACLQSNSQAGLTNKQPLSLCHSLHSSQYSNGLPCAAGLLTYAKCTHTPAILSELFSIQLAGIVHDQHSSCGTQRLSSKQRNGLLASTGGGGEAHSFGS